MSSNSGLADGLKHLGKWISQSGLCSRRRAQSLILNGRVTLNGEACTAPATRVSMTDRVEVNGLLIRPQLDTDVRLWRYHKPRGLISTHKDPEGRRTIYENLPAHVPRVNSVGRLDMESEGLMLLTNSTKLERQLELPGNEFERRYRATLNTGERSVTSQMVEQLARGLSLIDGTTFRPMKVKVERQAEAEEASERAERSSTLARPAAWKSTRARYLSVVSMTLVEGKKHEVRRAWQHFGFPVLRLERLASALSSSACSSPTKPRRCPRKRCGRCSMASRGKG